MALKSSKLLTFILACPVIVETYLSDGYHALSLLFCLGAEPHYRLCLLLPAGVHFLRMKPEHWVAESGGLTANLEYMA